MMAPQYLTERLSDETLKQIAESNGRCYPHEGRSMAQELIKLRQAQAPQKSAPSGPDAGDPSWYFGP